jgi:hypothetical protein
LDEAAIRADERRRMDAAMGWEVSCLGCSDRLDALIAERHAGGVEALRQVEAALMLLPATLGVVRGLAVVRDYLAGRGEKPAEALTGGPEGSGQGAPP